MAVLLSDVQFLSSVAPVPLAVAKGAVVRPEDFLEEQHKLLEGRWIDVLLRDDSSSEVNVIVNRSERRIKREGFVFSWSIREFGTNLLQVAVLQHRAFFLAKVVLEPQEQIS